jgi:nitrogen-specific signal transduction histidine kinase
VRIDALVRDVSEQKLENQTRTSITSCCKREARRAGPDHLGVAHELNNPLGTILTWAERLSQRPVDDTTKRGLETILSESERAAKIVRNLLTFARQGPPRDGRLNHHPETLGLRARTAFTNITVVDAPVAGPQIFADTHALRCC